MGRQEVHYTVLSGTHLKCCLIKKWRRVLTMPTQLHVTCTLPFPPPSLPLAVLHLPPHSLWSSCSLCLELLSPWDVQTACSTISFKTLTMLFEIASLPYTNVSFLSQSIFLLSTYHHLHILYLFIICLPYKNVGFKKCVLSLVPRTVHTGIQ